MTITDSQPTWAERHPRFTVRSSQIHRRRRGDRCLAAGHDLHVTGEVARGGAGHHADPRRQPEKSGRHHYKAHHGACPESQKTKTPAKLGDDRLLSYPDLGVEVRFGLREYVELDARVTGSLGSFFGYEAVIVNLEGGVSAYPISMVGIRVGFRFYKLDGKLFDKITKELKEREEASSEKGASQADKEDKEDKAD